MTDRAADLLEDARQRFKGGEYREALEALEASLIENAARPEAYKLGALILRMIGNNDLAQAFERVTAAPEEAEAYHDLGYRFVDHGYFPLAASFLARANRLKEGTPETLYELGWALYKSGRFAEALPHLEEAHSLDPDRRTLWTLASSLALLQRPEESRRFLERAREAFEEDGESEAMEEAESFRQALRDVEDLLARLAAHPPPEEAGIREWHWIQTGGALLNLPRDSNLKPDRSGRYRHLILTAPLLAQVIADLEALFEATGARPDVIEFLDPAAELPGRCIAGRLGIPARPGRSEGAEGTLHIASHTRALDGHIDFFADFQPGQAVMALVHDWSRDEPLCPDVIGLLASSHELPWDAGGGGAVVDGKALLREVEEILDKRELTGEEEEVAAFYRGRPLPLTRDTTGVRPDFPVESPVPYPP